MSGYAEQYAINCSIFTPKFTSSKRRGLQYDKLSLRKFDIFAIISFLRSVREYSLKDTIEAKPGITSFPKLAPNKPLEIIYKDSVIFLPFLRLQAVFNSPSRLGIRGYLSINSLPF